MILANQPRSVLFIMSLELFVGNYNYSSWSMRAGVLFRAFVPEFKEHLIHFDGFDDASNFKTEMRKISPTATVPALRDNSEITHDGTPLIVWDTLSIVEYIAEYCPTAPVWPINTIARAQARSLCAEMHSGFTHLRNLCIMNIGPDLGSVGKILWRDNFGLRQDVGRLETAWTEQLNRTDGTFLFGDFGAVDAYFSPVVMRLQTYNLPINDRCRVYMDQVCQHRAVKDWIETAKETAVFIDFEEPYRLGGDGSDQ